jgi:hypothetical protein
MISGGSCGGAECIQLSLLFIYVNKFCLYLRRIYPYLSNREKFLEVGFNRSCSFRIDREAPLFPENMDQTEEHSQVQ